MMKMITKGMQMKKEILKDKVTYTAPETEVLVIWPGRAILDLSGGDNEDIGDGGEIG